MTSADQLYQEAITLFPGGVNASARMNQALGRPFYVKRGTGPFVFDLEDKRYIDMCMSHGASLLGHNHPTIKQAVKNALEVGILCSYETEFHLELAREIIRVVPCAEMVRFAGSGTETIMHALRLARAATGRTKLLKFEGHFHGYADEINYSVTPPIVSAEGSSRPEPFPQSAGMSPSLAENLLVIPFNDPDALYRIFEKHGPEIATLILEPVNYDSGCILPEENFLKSCREVCDQYGTLLFFDEVLTAFRFALGGAQEYFQVVPDLAVLGKAFAAGMPISAIVGKRDVMEYMRPGGESEHSGTYLAHLTAVLAARAALQAYGQPQFYPRLEALGERFYTGFEALIEQSGVPVRLQYLGPRFGLFFGLRQEVSNYQQAAKQDKAMARQFYLECTRRGLYFHESPHHGFSSAHSETEIEESLNIIEDVLNLLCE